jgi:hypothetical protein
MNHGGPRVAAITVLALGGCAAMTLGDAPRVVQGFALPSYQTLEECYALKAGDRLEYRFESAGPVDFNLHYHDGGAVVMPVSRESSVEAAGVYVAPAAQDYCVMWEAGAAGAVLDYRLRVKPAGS